MPTWNVFWTFVVINKSGTLACKPGLGWETLEDMPARGSGREVLGLRKSSGVAPQVGALV